MDSLKYHWHQHHSVEAKALGVPLPSRERKPDPPPFSSSFSSSSFFSSGGPVTGRTAAHRFKWSGVKEQLLQTLTIEAGLQELTDDMKKRVKAYVNSPPGPPVASISIL